MEVFACDVILVGSLGTIITEMEEITFETLHEVREFICRMRIGKICLSPKNCENHIKTEGVAYPGLCPMLYFCDSIHRVGVFVDLELIHYA